MTILFGAAVLLFLITFLTTKERVQPIKEERNAFSQDFGDLLKKRALAFDRFCNTLSAGLCCHAGRCDRLLFRSLHQRSAIRTVRSFQCQFHEAGGRVYAERDPLYDYRGDCDKVWLCKLLDKSRVYSLLFILAGITTGMVYYLRPENLNLLFGLQLITSFCMGPVSVLQWAIYTDTADYSEWKTGRRATALIMAASLFALKLGVAFGGFALGWVLSWYGYEANTVLDGHAIKGICLGMSWYAAIPAFIAGALMLLYPLSNKRMLTIEADLAERRKQQGDTAEK